MSCAGLEPGLLDRGEDDLDRSLVGRQVGREAAFVAHCSRQPPLLEQALERVEDLDAPAHRFGEARRADRNDHELLHVDVVVGMRAAVDDVHHRHRQPRRCGRRRGADTAAGRPTPRTPWRAPATPRGSRSRPGAPWSACRRGRSSDRSSRRLIDGVAADQRAAQLAVDVRRRPWSRPCRNSAAGRRRAARALRAIRWTRRKATPQSRAHRPTRTTSAATVGLPRESRISKPRTC